jgi:alpha-tubulin suppressor-like RCC1 family protein
MHSLYLWGSNTFGQLCKSDADDSSVPICHQLSGNVQLVACGGNHIVWIEKRVDETFHCFACGDNTNGQLFTADVDGSTETPVNASNLSTLGAQRITALACGWEFSACITDHGELYVCGKICEGLVYRAATRVECDRAKFVAVACGMRHLLAIDDNGNVFGIGSTRSGELSIVQKTPLVSMRRVHIAGKALQVACGRRHSAVLCDDQTLLTFGSNKYGQLGLSSSSSSSANVVAQPTRVPNVAAIRSIRCMWDATVLVLNDNTVDVIGKNTFGARTHAKGLNCSALACGSEHLLAIQSDDNSETLIAWGWNEHGQLGDNTCTTPQRRVDVLLALTPEQTIVGVWCGGGFSVAAIGTRQTS